MNSMRRLTRLLVTACLATGLAAGTVSHDVAAAGQAPAAVAPSGLVYTVVRGDSLSGIAGKVHVRLADLLALNRLAASSLIVPGMQLLVPAGGSLPGSSAAPLAKYTVVKGDSLLRIAGRLHVTLADLLNVNKLVKTSVIVPGMQLLVPPGGTLPSAPTAPATPAAPTATYTVVKGDSLVRISMKLNVTLRQLLEANQLTKRSVIHAGTQLSVPAGGTVPTPTTASTSASGATASGPAYVVRSGDSLLRIANTLGVTFADLLAANHLERHSVIHAGMRLVVPAGGQLPESAPAAGSAPNDKVVRVLAFARAQLGEPYRFNAAGPDSWDCSGLTLAAYAEIGVSLPHYSAAQAKLGTPVDWTKQQILPGDLVFLETSAGSGVIGHVGIAISATQWIQAPRSGDVVRISSIPSTRVVAVRRYVQP